MKAKAKEVRFLGSVLGFGSDNPREDIYSSASRMEGVIGRS